MHRSPCSLSVGMGRLTSARTMSERHPSATARTGYLGLRDQSAIPLCQLLPSPAGVYGDSYATSGPVSIGASLFPHRHRRTFILVGTDGESGLRKAVRTDTLTRSLCPKLAQTNRLLRRRHFERHQSFGEPRPGVAAGICQETRTRPLRNYLRRTDATVPAVYWGTCYIMPID